MKPPIVLLLAVWMAPAFAQDQLSDVLASAYRFAIEIDDGSTAQYIPALASADPDKFGLVVITTDGAIYTQGDVDHRFAIMSAAKPFTLSLLLEQKGSDFVLQNIGVEPTGLPFNSLAGIERKKDEPLNPMVNAGAIAAVSLLRGDGKKSPWNSLSAHYNDYAGAELSVMEDVYESVGVSNYRNRALTYMLQQEGRLQADPLQTLDVYNKQSSVGVTAKQLAMMGATLANGGVNPGTGKRVIESQYVDEILSTMMLNGFYDESGWWAYRVGLPAKSGVGGGVVAVVPGQMAIVGYSPRLSVSGNSVRAMAAIRYLSQELSLSVFNAP
ncbi:MAG: glutaminase A [Halioglobus sp.]